MTAIGQYRHRVNVEAPGQPVPDGDGGWIETWVPLVPPVWDCAIEIASAKDLEQVTGGAVITTATHFLRGRYHPQLSIVARIKFEDRVFEIQSVHDRDQRRIEIWVLAREILSGDQPVSSVVQNVPGGSGNAGDAPY